MSNNYNTNFIANINGTLQDLGNIFYNWSSNTININSNNTTIKRYTINYKKPTILLETDITASIDGYSNNGDQTVSFGPQIQNKIVAVNSSGGNSIAFSNDGINFNSVSSTLAQTANVNIEYNGTMWVCVADNSGSNNIGYSYDGIIWKINSNNTCPLGYQSVYWTGTMWLLGGWVATRDATPSILYSYDGINWTGIANTSSIIPVVWKFASNGSSTIIAVGTNTSFNSSYMVISYDGGFTWVSNTVSLTSTITSGIFSICWNGRIWVATGQGTNSIAYTTDPFGINSWTGRGSTILNNSYACIWNGEMFIAVGYPGQATIAYSYDGIYWTSLGTSIFTLYGLGITWTGKNFIAGGSNGGNTLAYSKNGINWVGIKNSIFNGSGGTVIPCFNGSRPNTIKFPRRIYLAIGSGTNGNITYSPDMLNWYNYPNPTMYTLGSDGNSGICYNGRIWVAGTGTAGNSIAVSKNGFIWTPVANTSLLFSSGTLSSIVWTGTMFIAGSSNTAATGNCIAYSYEGYTWIPVKGSSAMFTSGVNGLSVCGQTVIALGSGGNTIATSTNGGFTWTTPIGIVFSSIGYTAACNGIMWIAGGNNGTMKYSSDNGSSWQNISSPFSNSVRSIVFNKNIWVAAGSGGNVFAYSFNGFDWKSGSSFFYLFNGSTGRLEKTPTTIFTTAYGVSWNGTLWSAVGAGTTTPTAFSHDGINWSPSSTIFSTGNAYGIATNANIPPKPFIQHPTIALGSGTKHTIAYSPDGMNWRGLGNNIFSTNGNRAFWNGKLWVSTGQGGNTLAYSYDGVKWTGLGSQIFSTAAYGVCYNGSIWVAAGAGTNTIAYSTNGITWTGLSNRTFTTAANGVVWNGTTFIINGSGGNTIAISTNGRSWTSATYSGTPQGYPATSGTLTIIPAGANMVYSTNINGSSGWTNISSNPLTTASCIAFNGTIWVAGATSGANTLAYSTNGTTWTGLGASVFAGGVSDICWNGTRFVATGSSYLGYSQNGINWYATNQTNIFSTAGYGIASNPGVGAFIAPSALVLSDTGISGNGMSASNTLEISMSDPFYQIGYNNICIKIESDNIY